MACGGCGKSRPRKTPVADNRQPASIGTVVEASKNTENKVRIRYYGSTIKKTTTGCATCSGRKSGYSVTTSETIRFVSEDAPGNWFVQTFQIGHDYYVTEKQAEYLLSLTYVNKAGQTVHKFKKEA